MGTGGWSVTGRGQFKRNDRCFWRLRREEDPFLNSGLLLELIYLAPAVFREGPPVQGWPVHGHPGTVPEPRGHLAPDGACGHLLGLF